MKRLVVFLLLTAFTGAINAQNKIYGNPLADHQFQQKSKPESQLILIDECFS